MHIGIGDAFEIDHFHIHVFHTCMTLILDQVIRHTIIIIIVYQSSTSTNRTLKLALSGRLRAVNLTLVV